MSFWWWAPPIVPTRTVSAKSAPKPGSRVISSQTAANSTPNGSRTPGLSASPPVLLRPKFWSMTSSRRSGASDRYRYRCFPDGKRTSSSGYRRSLQRADPTKKPKRKYVMAIPYFKELRIGGYMIKQRLLGRKRYPLVLMLEPLFRCNLACVGCGKIDYPDAILNRRMSAQECWDAADECGAPMVAIPGGEPLIHKEIGEIVRGLVARKKFVSLCTNAMLLEKKLDLFEPSPYLFFSVHLDGLREHHDKAVSQKGVFDRAVSAIKAAKARGFTVNVNATIFDGHPAEEIAKFLDFTTELGVGVSMSPGYAYERAPDQEHFLNRTKTKKLFRDVFARGKGKKWNFM